MLVVNVRKLMDDQTDKVSYRAMLKKRYRGKEKKETLKTIFKHLLQHDRQTDGLTKLYSGCSFEITLF